MLTSESKGECQVARLKAHGCKNSLFGTVHKVYCVSGKWKIFWEEEERKYFDDAKGGPKQIWGVSGGPQKLLDIW
jgi:hypothetical protein